MGPAHPPNAVENDPTSLSSDPCEVRQRGFGSSLRWLAALKCLHDTSGEQRSGNAFAVTGEGHTPDLLVRVEAAARQRRVPDPSWKGLVQAPGDVPAAILPELSRATQPTVS